MTIKSTAVFLATATLSLAPHLHAQDTSAIPREAKENASKLLSNPQLKGLIDNVKQNPEDAAQSAVDLFRKQISGSNDTSTSVPATRSSVPATRPAQPAATRPTVTTNSTAVTATQAVAPQTSQVPTTAEKSLLPETVAKTPRPTIQPTNTSLAATQPSSYRPADPLTISPELLRDAPDPREVAPKFDRAKATRPKGDQMEITSNESVIDNDRNVIIFTGNVIVKDPNMNMTSDRLEVYMFPQGQRPAAGSQAGFKKAIATGGMVEIERKDKEGKVQVAKSRRADIDPVAKLVTLTGGTPSLQNGEGMFVQGPKIILKENGEHQVVGGISGGKPTRNKVIIDMGDKKGTTKTPNTNLFGPISR